MGRPRKKRRIGYKPNEDRFCPRREKYIELEYEELEAIRLMDYKGLTQKESSELINVSRTTLQGIYKSARKKVAKALMENLSIRYKNDDYYEFYMPMRQGRGRKLRKNSSKK